MPGPWVDVTTGSFGPIAITMLGTTEYQAEAAASRPAADGEPRPILHRV